MNKAEEGYTTVLKPIRDETLAIEEVYRGAYQARQNYVAKVNTVLKRHFTTYQAARNAIQEVTQGLEELDTLNEEAVRYFGELKRLTLGRTGTEILEFIEGEIAAVRQLYQGLQEAAAAAKPYVEKRESLGKASAKALKPLLAVVRESADALKQYSSSQNRVTS